MNTTDRPDPDQLLSRLNKDEVKTRRGKLKIFFGCSAGVGKTYAMLKAANEQSEHGLNVLAGIVETHARPETEKLLEGLRILQPLEIRYRGLVLKELDIDAALTRKPDIILVDELAHTNAPGSRHPKRWNDVIEILDAGIDVYTTLNVQHIESLSDVVASATGVWVKETVPDTIFDMAEDVVLVDIDEDDLILRLREGKVYVAAGAMARASENFFKKSNLQALREIALRRTADRVDAERESSSALSSRKALTDKILVCIGTDDLTSQLLRTTKRFATALKAPWEAVHVVDHHLLTSNSSSARFIGTVERMVDRLGGKFTILRGNDILDEIISYAQEKKFTKIVVGKDTRPTFNGFISSMFITRLIRKSSMADVYVVSGETTRSFVEQKKSSFLSGFKSLNYVLSLLVLAAFSLPSFLHPGLIAPTEQALLYLIGVIIVADKFGFGPSLLYTLLAANFFLIYFLDPENRFSINNTPYLITFLAMLLSSFIVARQASRQREQANDARQRERKSHNLLALTRQLAASNGRLAAAESVAHHVKESTGCDITVWMINAEGHPSVVYGSLPEATYYKEFGALEWCLENNQNAGLGTSTLSSAAGIYFPLQGKDGCFGVAGFYPKTEGSIPSKEDQELLETVVSLLATSLERIHAGEIAHQALLEKETERLRQTFGVAGSENFGDTQAHPNGTDFKSYESPAQKLSDQPSPSHFRALAAVPFGINKRSTSLADLVARVNAHLVDKMKGLDIKTTIPGDLPDVLVDSSMVEQAISTFLTCAASKAEDGSILCLDLMRLETDLKLSITISLRQAFTQEGTSSAAVMHDLSAAAMERNQQIELTVAAGIIHLHGGSFVADYQNEGKLTYTATLPIA